MLTTVQDTPFSSVGQAVSGVIISLSSYSVISLKIRSTVVNTEPVPVAARSKTWVYGRWPVEIVGSNPTEGMDVCCECCVLSGRGP